MFRILAWKDILIGVLCDFPQFLQFIVTMLNRIKPRRSLLSLFKLIQS
jgi:hypothetical protein